MGGCHQPATDCLKDRRMSTIRDVARLANVSVATVSRVLNGSSKVSQKSKDAVLQAQKELGFYLNLKMGYETIWKNKELCPLYEVAEMKLKPLSGK